MTANNNHAIVMGMEINTERIKYEMYHKGLVVTDLANLLGVKERAVYAILQKRTTKLKTINKLGVILGVDPKDLLC